ncbi:DUF421 domain-containing protein [Bacillus salitolerans]|uniref:DUF421 domain-containing protein n=2 Tax=Bacillati TaxID=1783272 RepID=A0ABW4LPZ0_9BACI
MDWSLLWKAVVIVIGGTLILRFAGRKSISQMTLAQVVIMVGIGSLLVQPIVGRNVWATLVVGIALVATLVVIEYGQVKFDFFESFVSGKSKLLIDNGVIQEKNMLKLRMTVDQLEIQLRQNNVTNISDVQYATLEPSGKLGFILKQNKQNATKEDIQYILDQIQQLRQEIELKLPQTKVVFKANPKQNQSTNPNPPNTQTNPNQPIQNSLFEEVRDKGHHEEPPQYLQ